MGIRRLLLPQNSHLSGGRIGAATQVESRHGNTSQDNQVILVADPTMIWRVKIARACFEENAEAVFKAFSKALLRGNAYAFKELADRAFGKLKESHHLDISPYRDVPIQDMEARVKELEQRLGYVKAEEPAMLPPASDDSKSKPN